jgi:ATP-dependent exoDNAse (exonuclease V) alpha subunit
MTASDLQLPTRGKVLASRGPSTHDPIRDVQVLCPMNRGGLGARSLNIELQNALNPPGEIRIDRFGWTFCPGDKVMQIENDYDKEVYNGDLGVVSRIDIEQSELGQFRRSEVIYGFTDWCSPMRRRSTRARARNTPPLSSR